MAFMLGQTVRNGRKAGFAALFGSLAATFFHIAMAAIGLSAVIATSAVAFSIVKWVGVIYLLWLGCQAFNSSKRVNTSKKNDTKELAKTPATVAVFLQGMLISALNPKVAIFFLAFLPQFVVEGAGPISLQFLLHGSLLVVVGFLLQTPLIFMGSRVASSLRGNQKIRIWLDRCLGTMYFAISIRLAINKMGRGA